LNNAYPILSYYEWLRSDAIAAVPPDAKTVLSVGCAAGKTEAELVKRGIKVVGVELNPDAAKIARERGVIVLEGDASTIDVNIGYEPYDCIIYADILEHLADPVAVLKQHVEYLKPGGIVYVSIPNFRHYSVFWQLFILGRIRYQDAGVLDKTHLRITTRKMVLEWFKKANLESVKYSYGIPGRRNRLISACAFGMAREFLATQIVLVGQKPD
jgi:2-polyprenyl-3-methyl-5-hydroxy-6-metoxy-1,4-benzoquinol methylase